MSDYLHFGVEYVWVIDPQTQTAWQHTAEKSTQITDLLSTVDPNISISLAALFLEMTEERSD